MFEDLKAQLGMVEGRLRAMTSGLKGTGQGLRTDANNIDAGVFAPLDQVAAEVEQVKGLVKQKLGGARAALERLAPPK